MKASVRTVRAVGTEFAGRTLRSVGLVAGIVATIAVGVALWLTTVNAWWWFLAVVVIIVVIAGAGIFIAAMFVVKLLRPTLSSVQHTAVAGFVDKLQRIAEGLQTPWFWVFFRVVRDVVHPREHGFIAKLASDSVSLKSDYAALQKLLAL